MSLFINPETILQKAISNTKEEFREIVSDALSDDYKDNIKEGSPLVRCYEDSTAMQRALEIGNASKIFNFHETEKEPYKLMEALDNNIFIIKNAGTYFECVQMIDNIQNDLKECFYGALLINEENQDIILNPLHPTTAILMIDTISRLMNDRYKIIIYAFSNIEQAQEIRKFYNGRAQEEENIDNVKAIYEQQINNIIKLSTHKINSEIRVMNTTKTNSDSSLIEINYQIKKDKRENKDYELYLSTHQILTKGVIYPYYGSSIIKVISNYSYGKSISPMLSCNISKEDDDKWGSVCTGQELNYSIKGLRTLNHANLLSPYTVYTIYEGALLYVDIAIQKSLELYRLAEKIQGEKNE